MRGVVPVSLLTLESAPAIYNFMRYQSTYNLSARHLGFAQSIERLRLPPAGRRLPGLPREAVGEFVGQQRCPERGAPGRLRCETALEQALGPAAICADGDGIEGDAAQASDQVGLDDGGPVGVGKMAVGRRTCPARAKVDVHRDQTPGQPAPHTDRPEIADCAPHPGSIPSGRGCNDSRMDPCPRALLGHHDFGGDPWCRGCRCGLRPSLGAGRVARRSQDDNR